MPRAIVAALLAVSVLAPFVLGGAAFLLIAKALAGSWLWGVAAFVVFLLVYAIVLALLRRWGLRNPDRAQGFMSAWGRAMAFGSGAREARPKRDRPKHH